MSFKNFSLGLGMGIVFTSLVFGLIYHLDSKKVAKDMESIVQEKASLTDEEVIERAKELGLVSLAELPKKKEHELESEFELDDESEDYIIEKAKELGMIFPENEESAESTFSEWDNNESEKPEREISYVTVRVPGGANATDVAELLAKNDIVDSADEFRKYVVGQKKSTRLRAGVFKFSINSSYEEALNTLTTVPKG